MAGNSILEQMLEAATQGGGLKGGGQGGQGGLGDLLGQVLGGQGGAQGGGAGGGLGDILGGMLGGQPGSGGGTSGANAGAGGGGLGDILGQILGGAQGGAGSGGRTTGGGGLGDILGQVLGGAQGGGGRTAGGGGLGDILGQVLGGAGAGAGAGRASGGGFNPGPTGLETASLDPGGARSFPPPEPSPSFPTQSAPAERTAPDQAPQSGGMNDMVKYGGIAVLGMLAYKALRNWQATTQGDGAPAPSGKGFLPQQMPGGGEAFSNVLLQAMIAATQADGVVDEGEQRRLVGQLEKAGASAEDRQAIADQLRRRINPQSLVAAAKTPEMGLQIYAASALAISIDSPAERQYLDNLAQGLGIAPGLKAQLEQAVGRA